MIRTSQKFSREEKLKFRVENALKRSIRDPMTGCLLCNIAVNSKGYSYISFSRTEKLRTHRAVFEYFKGPPKNQVLHTCDIRNCIELEHLYDGTAFKNTQDMLTRGRGGNQYQVGYSHSFTNQHKRRV